MRSKSELRARPLQLARNLPARFYVDGEHHALEEEALLGPSWQLVGHASALPGPGSYTVATHLRQELVLTCDEGGVRRAFANVCRHRAGPVATGRGCARQLVCGYHGWRYALDGRLADTPGFGAPEGFDPASVRLRPLALLPWQGLLFAHRDGGTDTGPQERVLAQVAEGLGPAHAPGAYRFDRRVTYAVACNWKLYVDNYLEGYHVPMIHPGLNEQLDLDAYVSELGDHFTVQRSPLSGDRAGDARYVHLFPNTMLNCLPGRLQTNVVLPRGPRACEVLFDYYYASGVSAAAREADQAVSHQTQLEDVAICERVQRNMESGAYGSGRLSPDHEAALWAFQEWVRAVLREH